jgi:hypothetical protein
MTFLPIVERELRTAARLTATYRNRALLAGVVTGVAVVFMLFGLAAGAPADVGRATFSVLTYLTLLFCLLEGVRKTSDCLSEEKREGTLGLLFLTDLKGYDVVLGKLAGVALKSVYGLIAILPILSMPLLMGGVMPGEYWRMVLALMNILFFSLCTGLWVSSWSRSERESMGRTLAVMAVLTAATYFTRWVPQFMLSPVYAFDGAFERNYLSHKADYWHSFLVGQVLSWLLLGWSSVVLPRTWQEKSTRQSLKRRWEFGSPERRLNRRRQMLDINPAYWLAGRDFRERLWLIGMVVVIWISSLIYLFIGEIGYLPAFVVLAIVINLVLKMRIGAHAAHCLAEARQNNALEMLLATPMTVDDMIRGQFLALKRVFLLPLTLIIGVEFLTVVGGIMLANAGSPASRRDELDGPLLAAVLMTLAYVAIFVLDVFALMWAGMLFGLSSKKESQATTKTILLVLVAPMVMTVFWFCGVGALAFLGWPVFWIIWARSELRMKFRDLAARQFVSKKDAGWIPGTTVAEPPLPA